MKAVTEKSWPGRQAAWGGVREILVGPGQQAALRSHRATVIMNRVQVVAQACLGLTIGWVVMDFAMLPEHWGELASLRMAAALGFASLLAQRPHGRDVKGAYATLGLLIVLSCAFFLISQDTVQDAGNELAVRSYALLPFILMAGLGLFPLAVAEAILYAAPVLAAALVGWKDLPVPEVLEKVWLLGLVGAVAVLGAVSQLRYMTVVSNNTSRDPVTEAANRRSGEDILDVLYKLASRDRSPLSLLFVDIDDFKSINDRFGHVVGDAALRNVSERLRAILRSNDVLVRWGGEEFVALLPQTDGDAAERIVQRIGRAGLGLRPEGCPMTVSIGIAERIADGSQTGLDLVELADRRMFRAKKAGRNRCVTAGGRHLAELFKS